MASCQLECARNAVILVVISVVILAVMPLDGQLDFSVKDEVYERIFREDLVRISFGFRSGLCNVRPIMRP